MCLATVGGSAMTPSVINPSITPNTTQYAHERYANSPIEFKSAGSCRDADMTRIWILNSIYSFTGDKKINLLLLLM
jgi:hypothetical protein